MAKRKIKPIGKTNKKSKSNKTTAKSKRDNNSIFGYNF